MKRNGILNSEIASVLAYMGHTDYICIGDCGLPIPDGVKRIDVSIKKGVPSFASVLKEVALDMVIEEIILAQEIKEQNPTVLNEIKEIVGNVKITYVLHEEFKQQLKAAKAVIRTGECTPYANIILKSNVNFD
ncbi:D-ribose pyranase [Candidatus Epulonipiscium fishelsonii]|uniref:D-ribose pyranase n=1 Tax=Candidatus Epulonipiscium fishelsonii TaxID=77094 RepID=A0ACC8XBC8_9FIRM|nr:D-ribose pyranase [Epulopiscium sp. SCG-B11WGA-EpuloA1]ONI43449.1 D-ribose pyranase [Epulopiscium sp. SCG-B05WGA-EpuloA1]